MRPPEAAKSQVPTFPQSSGGENSVLKKDEGPMTCSHLRLLSETLELGCSGVRVTCHCLA